MSEYFKQCYVHTPPSLRCELVFHGAADIVLVNTGAYLNVYRQYSAPSCCSKKRRQTVCRPEGVSRQSWMATTSTSGQVSEARPNLSECCSLAKLRLVPRSSSECASPHLVPDQFPLVFPPLHNLPIRLRSFLDRMCRRCTSASPRRINLRHSLSVRSQALIRATLSSQLPRAGPGSFSA